MTDTWRIALAVLLVSTLGAWAGEAPYPPSPVITGIEWATSATQDADGSDLWPMTWSDDDSLYTAFGDGWGFDYPPGCPREVDKLSNGWAKIDGSPDDYAACNIDSNDEPIGQGGVGKKAYGMLSIDGVLYAAHSNANENSRQCEIWMSTDKGVNWTDSGWNFEELGVCAFLNFGKDYAGARDGYVYMYSPNTHHAYIETDQVVLARVPKAQIMTESAWQFFSGMSGGSPTWSNDIADRAPVFEFAGGCNRQDVTYNFGLGRYLMTMRARGRASGADNPNHFSIYDAPEPWGPWTTVYYAETSLPGMSDMNQSSGGWGESQHIPSKWISQDGTEIHVVYAGDDSFRIRKATLSTSGGGGSPVCGNGVQETGEDCDGSDLGGSSCQSLGLGSGSLACDSGCLFDTSGCAGANDPPGTPANLHRTDER
jgi:hypothetical protein